VNIKKWVKLQKTALVAVGDEKTSSEDGSDKSRTPQFPDLTQKKLEISKQVASGAMTAEQAKVARKKVEKEKKARRKKTDKTQRYLQVPRVQGFYCDPRTKDHF
jgi:hypothetical protein